MSNDPRLQKLNAATIAAHCYVEWDISGSGGEAVHTVSNISMAPDALVSMLREEGIAEARLDRAGGKIYIKLNQVDQAAAAIENIQKQSAAIITAALGVR